MKLSIFYWMRASASAVFLFGFDMIVISAAEKTIQSLWGHGAVLISALRQRGFIVLQQALFHRTNRYL